MGGGWLESVTFFKASVRLKSGAAVPLIIYSQKIPCAEHIFKERLGENKSTTCEYLWQPIIHFTYSITEYGDYTPESFFFSYPSHFQFFCLLAQSCKQLPPVARVCPLWCFMCGNVMDRGLDLAGRAVFSPFFVLFIQNHCNIIALWHWTQRALIKTKTALGIMCNREHLCRNEKCQ